MNWQQLSVSIDGRSSIFGEDFPARWEALSAEAGGPGLRDFREHEALQLLTIFAVHWETLAAFDDRTNQRVHDSVLDVADTEERVAVRFIAIELASGQVIVAEPILIKRLD